MYFRRFCNDGIFNSPLSMLRGVRRCACEIIHKQVFCSFSKMFTFVVEVLQCATLLLFNVAHI